MMILALIRLCKKWHTFNHFQTASDILDSVMLVILWHILSAIDKSVGILSMTITVFIAFYLILSITSFSFITTENCYLRSHMLKEQVNDGDP